MQLRWPMVRRPMAKQLIIDLDDTLVDTFDLLIRPLEAEAAKLLYEQGLVNLAPDELVERLLQLRRSNPASFYDELTRMAGGRGGIAVDQHRSIFRDFAVDALVLKPEVAEMLRGLKAGNRLVLMTEGRAGVQKSKIDHLQLDDLFDEVIIVDPERGDTKAGSMADYMRRRRATRDELIVIGNRLDREIAAAKTLSVRTIWLRKGEGCEAPVTDDERPDAIIESLLDLPQALESLRSSPSG